MTVSSLTWFDDDEPRDLQRWALAALIVLGIHLAAIAGYVYGHKPGQIGDDTTPIAVDFSPIDDTVDQPEVAPTAEPPPPEIEKPPPPPPPPEPQAVVAPEQPPPPKIEEQKPTPTPAPSHAARIAPAWEASLIKHLERFKPAPSENEEGIVILGITVEHNGHVLSHRIVRSSGHPDLDDAVVAMIERAQPLPPFPATMTEDKLDLTVPIRFSLK